MRIPSIPALAIAVAMLALPPAVQAADAGRDAILSGYATQARAADPGFAGFSAARAGTNIGHNPWRMTFVARHALMRGAEQKD